MEWRHPNSAFYFAKIGAEITGYLKLNWGQAQTDQPLENALEIERIYVKKDYQGRKIGQFLIQSSLSITEKMNKDWLWLGVWNQNPNAIQFYEKMGFKAFGEHVFQMGEEAQIDILMRRKFK